MLTLPAVGVGAGVRVAIVGHKVGQHGIEHSWILGGEREEGREGGRRVEREGGKEGRGREEGREGGRRGEREGEGERGREEGRGKGEIKEVASTALLQVSIQKED